MKPYQKQFIELAIANQALQFGSFQLKSGRISPYFFNAGKFYQNTAVKQLGALLATFITEQNLTFDTLFGPAYKGISIATSTAIALANNDIVVETCFDRKETKQHGEGGQIIGPDLNNKRIVIIDDVITAGTAIKNSMQKLQQFKNVSIAAVIVCLDRQEKDNNGCNSLDAVSRLIDAPIYSMIQFSNIEQYIKLRDDSQLLNKIVAYRNQYGITTSV